MFDTEAKLNRFLLEYFQQVVADIPAEKIGDRGPGGLHPPVWVLGHLAIVGEMGLMLLGDKLTHPEWIGVFGPRSSDEVANAGQYSKDEFVRVVLESYPRLVELLSQAPKEQLEQPHAVEVLKGTALETVADVQAHLLTTHFAFHLAQLSGWRRAAGLGPII